MTSLGVGLGRGHNELKDEIEEVMFGDMQDNKRTADILEKTIGVEDHKHVKYATKADNDRKISQSIVR